MFRKIRRDRECNWEWAHEAFLNVLNSTDELLRSVLGSTRFSNLRNRCVKKSEDPQHQASRIRHLDVISAVKRDQTAPHALWLNN